MYTGRSAVHIGRVGDAAVDRSPHLRDIIAELENTDKSIRTWLPRGVYVCSVCRVWRMTCRCPPIVEEYMIFYGISGNRGWESMVGMSRRYRYKYSCRSPVLVRSRAFLLDREPDLGQIFAFTWTLDRTASVRKWTGPEIGRAHV